LAAWVRAHLSYANVMATIAVFLALGGGAIAAFHLKKNSVKSKHIKDGQVASVDIADNGVTGTDIDEASLGEVPTAAKANSVGPGSVGTAGLADSAVTSAKIGNDEVKGADVDEASLGQVPSAALAASVPDGSIDTEKLATAPAVDVFRSTTETTSTAASTTLHPTSERYDLGGLHDNATNPENLTAPVSGTYFVSAVVDWDASSGGYRRTSIVGPAALVVATAAGPPLPSPAFTSQNVAGIARLFAGQSVHVQAVQGSGGDLAAQVTSFQMAFLGK
jgi:hypothetical protein